MTVETSTSKIVSNNKPDLWIWHKERTAEFLVFLFFNVIKVLYSFEKLRGTPKLLVSWNLSDNIEMIDWRQADPSVHSSALDYQSNMRLSLSAMQWSKGLFTLECWDIYGVK